MHDLIYIWSGISLTGLVCAAMCKAAWSRTGDPFHPAFFLAAPCFAAYFLQPTMLIWSEAHETLAFLSRPKIEYVVLVNCAGVLALLFGALWRPALPAGSRRAYAFGPMAVNQHRLRMAAIALGTLGGVAFAYGIWNVGGLQEAYGRGYGGGYSSIGYIRDAYWLCLPAIALLFLENTTRLRKYVPIAIFCTPFIIHGLLGARRGPTASVLICLVVAYGFAWGWRPRVWQFVLAAGGLGALLLFLVANRNEMHLQQEKLYPELGANELQLDRGIESYATQAGPSNEFIYGAGAIVNASQSNAFYWGGRYATVLFIRPVPRFIWPTKYQYASKVFGLPNMEKAGANFGVDVDAFERNLGWTPAYGAAPGLIADLWIEFWWGAMAALFAIGWVYNFAWRNAAAGDPFWTVAYTLMAAFSIYLVAQTFEAMLFRFLLTAGGTAGAWVCATGRLPKLRFRPPHVARVAGSR